MPRRLALLSLVVFASLLLAAACGKPVDEAIASQTVELVDRVCPSPKDPDQVWRVIRQQALPEEHGFTCTDDDKCPCGSFCGPNGICDAHCVNETDEDYGCPIVGTICTNRGICDVPSGPPAAELLQLEASTTALEVASPPTNQPFPETSLTVTLTGDDAPAEAPPVYVSGTTVVDQVGPVCPPNTPTCTPTLTAVNELQVKCAPDEEYADSCRLEAWSFEPDDPTLPDSAVHASQQIFVRPRLNSTAPAWEVRLTGDGKVAPDRTISVVRRAGDQPRDGSYVGRMVLSRSAAPVLVADPTVPLPGAPSIVAAPADLALRVTAIAKGDQLLIVDPTRIVGPSGKLRLGATGTTASIGWMSNLGGQLVGTLKVGTNEFTPASGQLRVRFTMSIPLDDSDKTTTIDGLLDLDRRGPITAPTCNTGSTCAASSGLTCDTALLVCLPGPAFATTTTAPGNAMSYPTMWDWDAFVSPHVGTASGKLGMLHPGDPVTPDLIEHLQCYSPATWQPTTSPEDAVFGVDILGHTGDLRCAGSSSLPRGVPLLNRVDAQTLVPGTSDETVGEMIAACTSELTATPGTATNPFKFDAAKCVSAGQVLPGIAQALSGPAGQPLDRRTAALLQYLLRGWVDVVAFQSTQRLEQAALGDADINPNTPNYDSKDLLDGFEKSWALLVDGTVADKLATLPPRRLAAPDYRGTNLPRYYWPGAATADFGGELTLTSQNDCGVQYACTMRAATIDPAKLDLSGDMSVAVELEDMGAMPTKSLLLSSPWIYVTQQKYNEATFQDRTINMLPKSVVKAANWQECRSTCASNEWCRTWKMAPNGDCSMTDGGGGSSTASPGSFVGVLDPVDLTPRKYIGKRDDSAPDTVKDIPGVISVEECQNKCLADSSCQGFRAYLDCKHFTSTNPIRILTSPAANGYGNLPITMVKVGHLDRQGRGFVTTSFALPRTAGSRRVVVTRAAGRYRVYQNGVSVGPASAELGNPRRGASSRFWVERANGQIARHVALWDSALDNWAAKAMNNRAKSNNSDSNGNYATRVGFNFPEQVTKCYPDDPNADCVLMRDQQVEIAVVFLETIVSQLRLLSAYLESVQGSVYGECQQNQTYAVREQVQDRFGRSFRTALYIEELAGRMHDRARQVECDIDAQCTAFQAGLTCGRIWSKSVDTRVVPHTGKMRTCTGVYKPNGLPAEDGMCVPVAGDPTANGGLGGNGTSTPGTVGTLTISFSVPTAGTYHLWGKVAAQDDAHSFWAKLDTGDWQVWDLKSGTAYEWSWEHFNGPAAGAGFVLSQGTHKLTLGVRDDGAVIRELRVTDTAGALPDDLRNVCYSGDKPYVAAAVTDFEKKAQDRWVRAQDKLDASMQAAAASAAKLSECRNPLGIEETDLPLYFTPGTDQPLRFFAASIFLQGLAFGAIGAAQTAFDNFTVEWHKLQDLAFQRVTLDNSNKDRINATAQRYSDQLEELCGTSSSSEGGLLGEFIKKSRNPGTCFVKGITFPNGKTCLDNLAQPISKANYACFTGSVGQALIAMKTAHFNIEAARLNWTSKQDQYEKHAFACAHLQKTGTIIDDHIKHMNSLRAKKGLFDSISGGISLVAGLASGTASFAAAVNLLGSIGDTMNGGGKVGWSDGVGASGKFLDIASGVVNLSGALTTGKEIAEEEAAFKNQMDARNNELAVMECFRESDKMRDEINVAAVNIRIAVSEFEQAAMAFAARRVRIGQLFAEGRAEVERESERLVTLPFNRFWLDRNIQIYQRKLARARRITYLYMRALEYDHQVSSDQRAAILNAKSATDLDAAYDKLVDKIHNDNHVGPRPATIEGRVVYLSMRQILGFPSEDTVSVGKYLTSPDSLIYDRNGNLRGRGFRFQLAPSSKAFATQTNGHVPNDCAEHITKFTGSVFATQPSGHEEIGFELWQSNNFASQKCVPGSWKGVVPLLAASHWPSKNLFDPDGELNEPEDKFQVLLLNPANTRPDQPNTLTTALGLMGRGLFAEYVVLLTNETLAQLDPSKITDVQIRIDYTAAGNGLAPAFH